MNATHALHTPWAEAVADALAGAADWVRAKLEAYAAARARARAVEHLERLSDRALHDIGLHRSQIRSVVYEGGR
ncbi:MAG TPA: DUF1127 domain-containing protein [Burkholderiales bacterium]|nr:DUF1127 domain-containing protein [Burkholderiales bacterium]